MSLGQPVYMEPVSQVTATPSVKIGSRRVDEDGNEYVYVYNASEYQGWPGTPLCLPTSTSGYTVTVSNAVSQVGVLAGTVHHSTITTGAYGWAMTKGLSRVRPDSSAVSMDAGVYLALGIDGGFVVSPVTLSTSTRKGYTVQSINTNYGTTPADCGVAWIKSDIW